MLPPALRMPAGLEMVVWSAMVETLSAACSACADPGNAGTVDPIMSRAVAQVTPECRSSRRGTLGGDRDGRVAR